MKSGKIGKFRIFSSKVHLFSRSTGRIKKLIVRKSSLCLPLLESKGIFFSLIIDRDMNNLVRYPFRTISKSFYSALSFCLLMYFASPSCIFVFSPSSFFVSYMYHSGGGGMKRNSLRVGTHSRYGLLAMAL
jgi:hypothetical protein